MITCYAITNQFYFKVNLKKDSSKKCAYNFKVCLKQVATRSGGRCIVPIENYPGDPDNCRQILQKNEAFYRRNVSENMCRMGRLSYWSWFDLSTKICAKNDFVTIRYDRRD